MTWAFVDKVARQAQDIEDELDPITYSTRTRGERVLPAARPVGEGVYALVRHDDHTHLVYELELPERPGPVQEAMNILPEASFVIQVKNPEAYSKPGQGLEPSERADYPRRLRQLFEGRRFIALDPPEFLDYEGCELLLIGASADLEPELRLELDRQRETAATAGIFEDLKMEKDLHPVGPLFQGHWE